MLFRSFVTKHLPDLHHVDELKNFVANNLFRLVFLKSRSEERRVGKECKFIKARQLVNSFSIPPICRGLRNSEFNSDFHGFMNLSLGLLFS